MFPDLDPSRLTYRRLAAMVVLLWLGWLLPLCLAACVFIWLYGFHPSQRIELRSASGDHRAFVENAGFLDAAYLLQACDWPWTFSRPFIVANLAAWPERYHASSSHWTGDGSAVVFRIQPTSDPAVEIAAGYDYREHRGWDDSHPSARPQEMERWLAERGGLGPDLGFQDWKTGETARERDYPLTIWLAAAGGFGISRRMLVRLVKNQFRYPKNTLLEPE